MLGMSQVSLGPEPPRSLEHKGELAALRAVATMETAKGLVVLLAAFGIVLLIHQDPWDIADGFLELLHISPDRHFAQVFLDWADTLTRAKLWTVAGVALIYSCMRFIEAYGLWRARVWAEWFALISGAAYLPFEIFKILTHASLFHFSLLFLNLAVVLYMLFLRIEARMQKDYGDQNLAKSGAKVQD
jgi:uncharacterized membrane protein (DUF2068 family)